MSQFKNPAFILVCIIAGIGIIGGIMLTKENNNLKKEFQKVNEFNGKISQYVQQATVQKTHQDKIIGKLTKNLEESQKMSEEIEKLKEILEANGIEVQEKPKKKTQIKKKNIVKISEQESKRKINTSNESEDSESSTDSDSDDDDVSSMINAATKLSKN